MNDEYQDQNNEEVNEEQYQDQVNETYPDQQQYVSPKVEVMGIISMCCALVGLPIGFCCSILGLPFPIAGIVLGVLSIKKINDNPDQFTGKGFAIAGLIISGFLLLLCIGMFILGLVMQANGNSPQMWKEILENMQKQQ